VKNAHETTVVNPQSSQVGVKKTAKDTMVKNGIFVYATNQKFSHKLIKDTFDIPFKIDAPRFWSLL
jgi:hypothetical protein